MVEPVARFNKELWLALGVLGFGLALAALVQVFVGLAPLKTLRAALGRVRSGDAQLMEGAFPAEIMPLVEEFNSVLAQNAEVVERARTQAGNLAHALKTPLSVLANAADGKDEALAARPRPVVREDDCVGCRLCHNVCPVEQCISMVAVESGREPVTWDELAKSHKEVTEDWEAMKRYRAMKGIEVH